MKASLKLREEKSPLLRLQLPFKLAGFPLTSAIAIGHTDDLALSLGTSFQAGPSVKFAYSPYLPSSPACFRVKTGIGAWGSPNSAILTMTAEFRFLKSGNPVFTMHLKPRVGDFSLRKHVQSAKPSQYLGLPVESQNDDLASNHEIDAAAIGGTPQQFEKSSTFTTIPERQAFPGSNNSIVVTPSEEGRDEVWQNDGFDHVNITKPSFDACIEHDLDIKSSTSASVDAESMASESNIYKGHKSGKSVAPSSWRSGVDGSIKGWGMHIHSCMPLGKQAKLTARWGLKLHSDVTSGWQRNTAPFSLPYLHLQKISVFTVGYASETREKLSNIVEQEQLLSSGKGEDAHELSHVAALCGSMKRQLHLLYAENEVLRKAMEDMKSQFEHRGSSKPWRPVGIVDDAHVEEQIGMGPKALEHSQGSKEAYNNKRGLKEKRDGLEKQQRENHSTPLGQVSRASAASDVSKKEGGLSTGGSTSKKMFTNSLLD